MAFGRSNGAVLGAAALVLGAGLALFFAAPSAGQLGRQIAASVKHSTGRDLAIRGPVGISWGWSPVLTLNDVALANADGGSRPVMMTVPRVDASVPLLALLFGRAAIDRLTLVRPEIWLERTQRGEPNWRLSPFVPGVALVPDPGATAQAPAASISVSQIRIEGGSLTSHDAEGAAVLAISSLDLASSSSDEPIRVSGRFAAGDLPVDVTGEVGSWAGLQDADRKTPWPVRLALSAADARATLSGGMSKPMQMRGYALKLDATVPDLSALQPLFRSVTAPPLRDLSVSAQFSEGPAGSVQLASVQAKAGPSDLSAYAEGLSIVKLEIAMPRTDRPARATAEGSFGGQPLRFSGSIGAPGALLGGNQVAGAMPVDISALAGGATLTARGQIGNPGRLTNADLAISARIPDLASLSPFAGRPLPPFQAIVGTARLRDRDGGLWRGVVLQNVKLTAAQGDIGGDLTLTYDPQVSVQGSITSTRLDLDAIQAALALSPAVPSAESSRDPSADPKRIVPDTPLPFAALQGSDADLRFKATSLIAAGTTYRDANGRLAIKDGKLRLDPLTAQAQGGSFNARLVVDAAAQPDPSVSLALRATHVPLRTLLAAADLPDDASATAEIDLDLRGTGSTPRAIVAGGSGRLGFAAVNGRVGGRLLSALVADPMRRAGVSAPRFAGQSELRCLAGRLDLRSGTATVRGLYLNTADAQLEGTGTIDFTNDTLTMVLTPTTRGGDGVPIRLTGPVTDPKASVLAGADSSDAARLPRRLLDPSAEGCTQPLALARDGRAGPMPMSLTSIAPLPPVPLAPVPLSPLTSYPPRSAPIPLAPGQAPIPLTPPPASPAAPAARSAPAGPQQKPVDLFQFLR